MSVARVPSGSSRRNGVSRADPVAWPRESRGMDEPGRPSVGTPSGVAVAAFLVAMAAAGADAQPGSYLKFAVGRDWGSVTGTKRVGLDVPPASEASASGEAPGRFGAVAGAFGYAAPLPARLLVSGEVEAAFYWSDGVRGFLREGTGLGEREVWPGGWSLEKNGRLGVNAKVGLVPDTLELFGRGGSVYLLTGVHLLWATVGGEFDNGVLSGATTSERALRPWIFGGGLEWGGWTYRLQLEARYAAYGLDFRDPDSGDGSSLGSPRLDHSFDISEWSVFFGIVTGF